MENYGAIESGMIVEPPAAPSKKLRGRKMIAAVAALALVVVGAAVAAVSVSPSPTVCGKSKVYGVAIWVLHPTPRPDSRVGLRAGPQGSLREAAQRPHGLHGPVPEVPQRASYDDVLQVLSGVLGPRPPIGTKADPPPSLCP